MAALDDLMSEASTEMTTSLAKTRKALSHNLSKGEAVEESFRVFIRDHLPASVGITKGEVIDSRGVRSCQLDVIAYDAARTPMLFTSDDGEHQLVPSEGVIAVFEVKTSLRASKADEIIKNMKSVKNLDKSAYYYPAGPIEHEVTLYGTPAKVAQTMYFVFAFEGDNPSTVASAIENLQQSEPLDSRVDCACILDSGVLLNLTADGQVAGLPQPGSRLLGYPTKKALLMFYIFFSRYLLQISHNAIDMHKYIPKDLAF